MKFEWDVEKAAANEAKHDVSFEEAVVVFDDPNHISWIDDRRGYGELRWVGVGLSGGVEITVVFTMRGEASRIISARRSTTRERKDYSDCAI